MVHHCTTVCQQNNCLMENKLLSKVLMGTKKQFKLYLEEEIVDRLETVASRSGKRSGQEVVEELIDVYLPVWVSINDSMQRAINYQKNMIAEEMATVASRANDGAAFDAPKHSHLHIVEDEEIPHGGTVLAASDEYIQEIIDKHNGKKKQNSKSKK